MARPGPSPTSQRKTGNWTDVENIPYAGPGSEMELPDVPGVSWFPQVEGWWEVIRTMPHCRLWEASDWLFAIDAALLKQCYYNEYFGGVVHANMVTEIRRREDQMGTTMEARRKNGMRYIDPRTEAEAPAEEQPNADLTLSPVNVTEIDKAPSRRARLAG